MKIAIIGYSGAGKSTMARRLGNILGASVLHLDSIHFSSGWAERSNEDMTADLDAFLAENDSWVIDGNYMRILGERRFSDADAIILLSLPRLFCFFSALGRYFKNRGRVRESIADGCEEKFDAEFARWLLIDGRTKEKRKRFEKIISDHSEKSTILKSRKEINRFVSEFERKYGGK